MQSAQMTRQILIVDDDPQMRLALKESIGRMGYEAILSENGEEALVKLREPGREFSLVVTDMRMPRMDGLSLLKEIRRAASSLPVLVITGFGTVETAVEMMKEGATDFLVKPFPFEKLQKTVDSIVAGGVAARTAAPPGEGGREIITASPRMKRIVELAEKLADSEITVLIQGESGTGKELLARRIHKASSRAGRPFVAVNCAAIPENLLESELFGHEKGSFTGAVERKKGKFELAGGGTILLDEIGETSLVLQAKLLRVLQEKEIDRVGGKAPVPVDARVIATTNRDLWKECAAGRFREDLYYRLNVFPIEVPALRDRPEDIEALAGHFTDKFSVAAGKTIEGISENAMAALRAMKWRGNIRELQNVMHRAVFLARGPVIEEADLMLEGIAQPASAAHGKIRDMERDLIIETLRGVDGNRTRAARILGVSVRTIRNKLKEYGENFS
ncbi:MAG: sigma-54 dependent transcriptional regulator [Nitrospiraceae bacterium]|nr:sigma-54 dependent transcriptional regulator [Nitrospiraceae bacterium]